ncbi:MAG: hypothetical protein IPP37_13470 [Saprospiraceae bacterium]|nr:hypothetical protein [Saprospiraceae bacterium]
MQDYGKDVGKMEGFSPIPNPDFILFILQNAPLAGGHKQIVATSLFLLSSSNDLITRLSLGGNFPLD